MKVRAPIPIKITAGKGSVSGPSGGARLPVRKGLGRGWIFLLLSAAILLAVLWWHWDRGWEDLESGLRKNGKTNEGSSLTHVPADVMAKLVTHRVDPDYPEAARPANLQGVIVLNVVVGRDGSVVDMHAQNGPEELSQAAMDALRWWRFEPYRIGGQPVVVETTVAVEFKP
jgi:TonB family protein